MLEDKVKDIPHKPGVYKFLSKDGTVLYVGKAKDLRSRVSQYFSGHDTRAQLPFLMAEAVDFDYIVVNSELESLFLENTLIKQYMPIYNIKLRDDKNYAFIKIDYSTEIPQITYARKIDSASSKQDKYFGPYSSTAKIRQTLDFVRRVFPYCANKEIGTRPCFYYYLHRCPGICVGAISMKEYQGQLERISLFLSGKNAEIKKTLRSEMENASKWKHFESAARLRDQLRAIEVLDEKQTMLFSKKVSWDILSVFVSPVSACVNVFKVRDGKLIDKEDFIYDNILGIAEQDRAKVILQTFAENYYLQTTTIPSEIFTQVALINPKLVQDLIKSRVTLEKELSTSRSITKISSPVRGEKLKLIKLGTANAEQYLIKWQRSQATNLDNIKETLKNLQQILNLPKLPRRIEGYDISNTQGTNPVGSMVVAKDGLAAKSEYRKFKIKSKNTPDDFLMMREMLTRRLAHFQTQEKDSNSSEEHNSEESNSKIKINKNIWPNPDLLVIDGGKGQLGVAVEVLEKMKIKIPVIGLAKRIEEIFLPHNSTPIILSHDDPALQLLQRLRDEAHRFGITFHRNLRSKQATKSALDDIPGIGPKTKKLLKQKIGTVAKIQQTPIEELTKIVGPTIAKKISEHLA